MTQFLLVACAFITSALLFVLVPLLRRRADIQAPNSNQANLVLFQQQLAELIEDRNTGLLEQQQYESARRDLERVLVSTTPESAATITPKSGRWAAPLLVLLVPSLAIGVYLYVGNYQAIAQQMPELATSSNTPNAQNMAALVDSLAEKMQTRPDDLQGWVMLGRSALVLGQLQRAVAAYAQALRLAPKDPEIMLNYADALAQVAQNFDGRPMELINAAMAIDPNNPQGLWLMGFAEFQHGATAKAVEHWSALEAKLPPGSKEAATIRRLIVQAQQGKKAAPTTH